jgi:serine/threonine-protein kinase
VAGLESQQLTVPSVSSPEPDVSDAAWVDWRVALDHEQRYEHRGELGRGGMGEVALAFDRGIDREVAVKRLRGSAPDEVARFVDEARIIGRLEHPNIVPVHDIGVDRDGRVFFVMKYVDGETLRHVIDRLAAGDPQYHARYPFEHRLDLFQGLLRALQYAHGRGILHRDIKPDNIMIGRFGEVMLMDWGIASRLDGVAATAPPQGPTPGDGPASTPGGSNPPGATPPPSWAGTPPYMSPEQAAGREDLDARSDLYSAFVVLYELLTLTRYVQVHAKSMHAMLLAVQERKPPTPADAAFFRPEQPAVPTELRHFLRAGLQQAPADRFADADAVLRRLQDLRAGEIEVQCPVTFAKHLGNRHAKLLDRNPWAGLFAMFGPPALLLIAVVVLLLRC